MKVTRKIITGLAVALVLGGSTTSVFAADGMTPEEYAQYLADRAAAYRAAQAEEEAKKAPVCAVGDGNCDGVITCDEAIAPGWDWDEAAQACVYSPETAPKITTPRNVDLNHDGVVTCDEAIAPGWDWDESVKACVFVK